MCARESSTLAVDGDTRTGAAVAAAKVTMRLASVRAIGETRVYAKMTKIEGESSSSVRWKPASHLAKMPTGTTSARQADYLGA